MGKLEMRHYSNGYSRANFEKMGCNDMSYQAFVKIIAKIIRIV
ncbi:hypothetical protein BGS_1429 [Beggiatoa sp. SS]|nr:hypothetical protein BGS_1429 [Beggiatoa sp. SS]